MGLKELSKQANNNSNSNSNSNSGGNLSQEKKNQIQNSVILESAIEGSVYFLYGCVYTYYRLKGLEIEAPDVVMKKLKSVPKFTDEDEKKRFLANSDEKIHQFLHWYFYDKERDSEVKEKD